MPGAPGTGAQAARTRGRPGWRWFRPGRSVPTGQGFPDARPARPPRNRQKHHWGVSASSGGRGLSVRPPSTSWPVQTLFRLSSVSTPKTRSPPATIIAGSQRRPDAPRGELLLAHSVQLALRLFPARYRQDFLKDLPADLLDGDALQHLARVDIHVAEHVVVERGVRRHLDRRGRLAPEHAPPAGREDEYVRPAGHDPGHAHRVVTGRVHDHHSLRFDRLGILDDIDHGGAPGLGDRAEGLFVDGGEPALLVPHRWVVVDLHPEDAGIPLPPLDPLDQLLADLAGRGPAGQEVLGPVDLRRLPEDRRPALLDDQV